jgi:hypothetical protein
LPLIVLDLVVVLVVEIYSIKDEEEEDDIRTSGKAGHGKEHARRRARVKRSRDSKAAIN